MDEDITLKSRRNALRGLAGLITTAAFALMLGTSASAAPIISIATPQAGATTGPLPTFSGASTDAEDLVTVLVHDGTSTGTVARTLEVTPQAGGAWTVELPVGAPLPAGEYTAVAEQSELGEPGQSEPVSFTVDTEPPTVTINQPAPRTNKTVPSFSGKASENTQVTVHVMEGATEVAHATVTASGDSWSTNTLSTPLEEGRHSYTVYATEKSGLGNEEGESATRPAFEVDTLPPEVTIKQPLSPSPNTSPTFSGTASEAGEVVVHVVEGSTEMAHAIATVSGGSWTSGTLSKALSKGKHTYKAYASEASALGNKAGTSPEVTFEVNTNSPKLTLTGPESLSNDTSPSFSGTTTEEGEVVVHIFEGSTPMATPTAQSSGGKWSTAAVALKSGDHRYSAYATEQASVAGNPEGQSSTIDFEIDTNIPVVTINTPPARTNQTTPPFNGQASEETEVTVHVMEGSKEVAHESTMASGGSWSTSTLNTPLAKGRHSYTVYATEKSAVPGNEEGESATKPSFEVDTEVPKLTMSGPPSLSNDTSPTFSGTTSEDGEVIVHVLEEPSKTEVASATTTAAGGKWSTSTLSKALPSGKHSFSASATEESGLGNGEGQSNETPFEVNTLPPVVSIVGPPSPTNVTMPSFSGAASENTEVVVHIFEEPSDTEVASATTIASGGKWSASALSKALPSGKHKFTAYAKEKSGLGNAEGQSSTVEFEVNTLPPEVSIVAPPSPSKVTTPPFSGTASENTEVVVHVFEQPSNTEVASATTTAAGGKWSTSTLSKELPSGKHKFTAYAMEKSGLGNGEGQSETVPFEVDNIPPEVSIVGPPSPSNNTTPPFSGTASENTTVVVHVFEEPGKTEVASATTTAAGGKWSTSTLSKELPSGKHKFTAYALEKSGLGNGEGQSSTVEFEVNTKPPEVSIVAPPSPSKDQTPPFSGTASENTTVVVHVFEEPSNTEVATATTTAAGGKWSTSTLSKELPSGKHKFTAYAIEKSGLGNGEGQSETVPFEVNTLPPVVSIVTPPSPSKDQTPPFSGTASENTTVVVHVFEEPGKTEVASATTTAAGGKWSTSTLSKELPSGKHKFTAYAMEKSGLGNGEGQSETVPFEVNTLPPVVSIVGPPSPSNNVTPSFSGTASENTTVVVHVFEEPSNTEVASATTTAAGGNWSTSTLSKTLPTGKHTFSAYAKEKSGLGNGEGQSEPVSFEVNTEAPKLSLNTLPEISNNTSPTFSGTTNEDGEIVVHIFEGSTQVASAAAQASGGSWSTSPTTLKTGDHHFRAYATEKSGLGNGEGQSNETNFEVDTNPPTVSIVGPKALSNNTVPAFSGTASENTAVVVHVFEEPGKTEVASVTTTAAAGKWSTSTLSKELPSGKHKFTAYALEKSGLGNAEGKSETVPFEVNTKPPEVSIVAPPSPSKNQTPPFSGTASEETEVVVHVLEGTTEVASASTKAVAGKWSTSTLTKALPSGKHTFSAYATEKSGLGNGEGQSEPVEFEVNTKPPEVSIVAPPSPSDSMVPSFSGTASEETEVVVHVFEGTTEVANASTKAVGGTWSTSTLSAALAQGKHKFTAYAIEKSGLGNGEGKSNEVSFEVNTLPPEVSIAAPPSPSKNQTPPFSGMASENTEVVVHVFEEPSKTEVASVTTTASGGKWSTSTLNKALPTGKHKFTAYAMEKSGLGNAEGKSSTVEFEVNTLPPAVTIGTPPSPSKNQTPPFSGTASENTEVVVHVFEGTTEEANVATTASGGKWSTSTLNKALPTGKHTFTAYALEKSGLGNAEGKSSTVEFEVNTKPPEVSIVAPPSPSKNQTPPFSGMASENTEVVVHVFEEPSKTEVASVTTTASGGKWSTSTLSKALPSGKHKFTAYALEKSGLGNGEGQSSTVEFEVNTKPPEVSIVAPPSPSNNTIPAFSGETSENTEVVVHVFEEPSKTEVASVATTAANGKWSTSTLTKALPTGKHTFTAYALEKSGLGNAEGQSKTVSFEVNTNPPEVVIVVAPKSPSNNTKTPVFSGTASENTEVVVHVFEEPSKAEVASVATTAAGGQWATSTLSKELPSGKHTFSAYAMEKSGLGNAEGQSKTVTFEVNTEPPAVSLESQPLITPEKTPSFSGTASETQQVTVEVFKGPKAVGTAVAKVAGTVSAGRYKTSAIPTELAKGEYTAIASEPSSLGNATGYSAPVTWEVEPEAPLIKITPPVTPTKNVEPSFSGTVVGASGETATVLVHEGTTKEGRIVAELAAQLSKTGKNEATWKTGKVTPALPSGKHSFTLVASVPSSLGNGTGASTPVPLVIDTEPPVVTIAAPPEASKDTTPSFSGTASEETEWSCNLRRRE